MCYVCVYVSVFLWLLFHTLLIDQPCLHPQFMALIPMILCRSLGN